MDTKKNIQQLKKKRIWKGKKVIEQMCMRVHAFDKFHNQPRINFSMKK